MTRRDFTSVAVTTPILLSPQLNSCGVTSPARGFVKNVPMQHLQRALTYDPAAAASHLFLAETYLAMGRRDEARQELQCVLDAPVHPDWVPEVGEFKQRASALLAMLQHR